MRWISDKALLFAKQCYSRLSSWRCGTWDNVATSLAEQITVKIPQSRLCLNVLRHPRTAPNRLNAGLTFRVMTASRQ